MGHLAGCRDGGHCARTTTGFQSLHHGLQVGGFIGHNYFCFQPSLGRLPDFSFNSLCLSDVGKDKSRKNKTGMRSRRGSGWTSEERGEIKRGAASVTVLPNLLVERTAWGICSASRFSWTDSVDLDLTLDSADRQMPQMFLPTWHM